MFKTVLLLSAFATSLASQTGSLTDERIVNLAKGGLSEDELVRRIASAPAIQFELTPAWTDYMLKSGVSENVIKAMAARETGAPIAPPQATQPERVAPVVSTGLPAQRADGRTRIFVGETSEWQASSFNIAHASANYSGAVANGFGVSHAGLMKLTISVMNHVNQHCPGVLIVNRPDIADLFVRLDQSTSMWARHDDMAVFNRAGEMTFVTSTHSISKDAKQFCESLAFRQP